MFRVTILSLFFISFSQIKSSDTGTPSPTTAELIKIIERVSCDEPEVVVQKYEEKCRQLLNQQPMTVTTSPQAKKKEKKVFIEGESAKRRIAFGGIKRKNSHQPMLRHDLFVIQMAGLAKAVAQINNRGQKVSIRGAEPLSPIMYPAPIVYPE